MHVRVDPKKQLSPELQKALQGKDQNKDTRQSNKRLQSQKDVSQTLPIVIRPAPSATPITMQPAPGTSQAVTETRALENIPK